VDVTNYVLHELGQPLHAFDANKIKGHAVHVKTLPAGTKFVTLDGVERELHQEDLMICDAVKPMCIAGVFGGIESGVTEETTSIFLESAYFDPISIRKTAKRHGLNTDASFRFERGIDPNITEYALMRAAILMLELAGGEITSDIVDIYPKKIDDHQVVLNFEDANRLIGQEIPRETVKRILTSLDIKVNNVTETGIGLTIPAYRNDVIRQADVIEEVLRVYGYNNIDFSTKLNATIAGLDRMDDHHIQQRVGSQLTSLGFYEIMTNSLTSSRYGETHPQGWADSPVEVLNPLSQDLGIMRQHMLFGALETLVYNQNRKRDSVRLFEFGKTYGMVNDMRVERKQLFLLASGPIHGLSWSSPAKEADFFYMKGVLSSLLRSLGIVKWEERDTKASWLGDGLDIHVSEQCIASVGILHHNLKKDFDLSGTTVVADVDWDKVLSLITSKDKTVDPIPKYPEVRRDLALLLKDHVRFGDLQEAAFKTERKLLRSVDLFDVYTGKSLPSGTKSYALSFVLRDDQRTLTDKQIDKVMSRLQQVFEKEFDAQLR
jgi:phenylalanyl-tRNA synthetase beta chain